MLNIQPSIYQSFENAVKQIMSHVLSVSIALSFGYLIGSGPVEMAIVTMLVISLNKKFNMQNYIVMGVVAAVFVLDAPQNEFLSHAITRSYAIFLGLAAALSVNLFIAPPRYRDRLVESLKELNSKTVNLFQSSVEGFINLKALDDKELKEEYSKIDELFKKSNNFLTLYKKQFSRDSEKEREFYIYKIRRMKWIIMNLKVAMCQMEVVPARPDINTRTMLNMISKAREEKADIVIFPEMCIPGYLIGDTWERLSFLRDCEEYGMEIVRASRDLVVMFGNVGVDWNRKNADGRVRKYNAFFIAQNGKLIGDDNFLYPFRIKTLLPNYREFDDERHFYSLLKLSLECNKSIDELLTPVYVSVKGCRIGVGCFICEDNWDENYYIKPIEHIIKKENVQLLVNISSSPFSIYKNHKRNKLFSQHAKNSGIPLVYINNVGIQNNGKTVYVFDGSSAVYDCEGNIVFCQEPFCSRMDIVNLSLNSKDKNPCVKPKHYTDIEYIYKALHYGIEKFIKSIGISKIVIGVSGGIDSSVSAALYSKVVGSENVLLVNMPSKYTSKTTQNLAKTLAKNLECKLISIPIQHVVDYTIEQIKSAEVVVNNTGNTMCFNIDTNVIDNIQARDRSARLLAAIAAAVGGVFTCNANKTELTVGYSTLYGDYAGFFAALADLWKHQIYELAKHLNKEVYGREVIPQGIMDLIPSAELNPEQSVDEGKGDPLIYDYHDYLFKAFVEMWNRADPEDILTWYIDGTLEERMGLKEGIINKVFSSAHEFIKDLEKWWGLFNGLGLAKRIQSPPILAVSRRAYGFDYRESQNGVYFSKRYQKLKEQILNKRSM